MAPPPTADLEHDYDHKPLLPTTAPSSPPELQQPHTANVGDIVNDDSTSIFSCIWNNGVIALIVSCCGFSVASALVRPLDPSIPVFEIVVVRSCISLMLSATLYRSSGATHPFFGQKRNIAGLAMRGLCGAAAMDCFYAGLMYVVYLSMHRLSLVFVGFSV
jgi:hypothetical protein